MYSLFCFRPRFTANNELTGDGSIWGSADNGGWMQHLSAPRHALKMAVMGDATGKAPWSLEKDMVTEERQGRRSRIQMDRGMETGWQKKEIKSDVKVLIFRWCYPNCQKSWDVVENWKRKKTMRNIIINISNVQIETFCHLRLLFFFKFDGSNHLKKKKMKEG